MSPISASVPPASDAYKAVSASIEKSQCGLPAPRVPAALLIEMLTLTRNVEMPLVPRKWCRPSSASWATARRAADGLKVSALHEPRAS